MKPTYLLFLLGCATATVGLTGCGRTEASPAQPAPAAAGNSARAVTITADDTMKFSTAQIYARPGETLQLTLTSKGAVPKAAMAHNWVLLKPGVDLTALATAGFSAAATNYIPASFADQVLATTKLLGPNESDTTVFTAPAAPGRYPFVCTFPGHMLAGMKGELVVE